MRPIRPIPLEEKNDAVSSYFYMRMCFNNDPMNGYEVYDFKSLDNLPPCSCKYDIGSETLVSFRYPPATDDYRVMDLPLLPVLRTLGKGECFKLNPARWDRVKKQISEGSIEYPWISIFSDSRVALMDGRHRIVALLRLLGWSNAPFIVEQKHCAQVAEWLKSIYQENRNDQP